MTVGVNKPQLGAMEHFLAELSAYADAVGRTPQHVLRQAIGASWGQWASWNDGKSSPTLHTVDKIRKHMLENPSPESEGDLAA